MSISANFTVSSYPVDVQGWENELIEQEFPYRNQEEHDEQRQRALDLYADMQRGDELPGRIITVTRLSWADLAEGDYAPTLLRTSADPAYEYEGFPYI